MHQKMRTYHRYLGFFLAGIMIVYSISGIVMIFRNTDTFKVDKVVTKELSPDISPEELGQALRIRDLAVEKTEGELMYFEQGTFNTSTGVATYTVKQLPYVLEKMTKLHKATTKSPLFFLNIFFGISLFFFVLSSFWMFLPNTSVFRKGLYFALGGLVFALLLVFL